jgi:hypothetical protein
MPTDKQNSETIKTPEEQTDSTPSKQTNWVVIVVAVIGVLMIFMAGAWSARFHARQRIEAIKPGIAAFGEPHRQRGMRDFHSGGHRAALGSNANQLRGVVTAINDTSFTLAGGGTTNTVQTTSSTTYTGGDKVAVNDSVLASGTVNNGTFTATQIVINP